jgi:predicted lipoprotein with Yx(FWY)xxD motif
MKSFRISVAVLATVFSLSAAAADNTPLKKSDGVLVNSSGMTVYTFDKDTANSGKSACSGGCLEAWPAVPAGDAAVAAPYSVVTRDDGSKQLAYKGKPLYTFAKDKKQGDRTGDKFKDMWHVVTD